MTNRGMVAVGILAHNIRESYYAGDIPRGAAFDLIRNMVCEMLDEPDAKLRRLKACAFTYAYMEPDVEC